MSHGRFGTVITCMDGRVQEPVARWMKERYYLDYVDTITEPGADKLFTFGPSDVVEQIKAKVHISLSSHGSQIVVVVGHHGCLANPVSKEAHLEQIRAAMQVVRSWSLAEVVGVWVNEQWQVEEVRE